MNVIIALVVGIVVMTAFAATLMMLIQLIGAVTTGFVVGALTPSLAKSALIGFISGIFGTVLAGVLWGFVLGESLLGYGGGSIGGLGGLLIGAVFGVLYGIVALIAGVITAFFSRRIWKQ